MNWIKELMPLKINKLGLCWQLPHIVMPNELRGAVLWCCGQRIGLLGTAVPARLFVE